MNYGEIKSLVVQTSTRTNVSTTVVESWIKTAIRRAQRLLRTPASEVIGSLVITSTSTGIIDIPGDLLSLVSIDVDGVALTRVDLSTVNANRAFTGNPLYFCRDQHRFLIAPMPFEGQTVRIVYSADYSALSADTDENWLTRTAPELIIAGAMIEFCRMFLDVRQQVYEQQFMTTISELNTMAQADELTNASIQPGISFDFGD